MIDARTLALSDLLHHGYHPPAQNDFDHERLMQEWSERYRIRLVCAAHMLAVVTTIDAEEPCTPPSP